MKKCKLCGRGGRSETMIGNQNARKSREDVRSKDNMDGFLEGKEFSVGLIREWAKEQEIYIYQPNLKEFLKKI